MHNNIIVFEISEENFWISYSAYKMSKLKWFLITQPYTCVSNLVIYEYKRWQLQMSGGF